MADAAAVAVGDQVTVHVATINGAPRFVKGAIVKIAPSGRRFRVACEDGEERAVHACNVVEIANDTWFNAHLAREQGLAAQALELEYAEAQRQLRELGAKANVDYATWLRERGAQ